MYEEMDEDLIPAYKCIKCNRGTCKDDTWIKLKSMKCICLSCHENPYEVM